MTRGGKVALVALCGLVAAACASGDSPASPTGGGKGTRATSGVVELLVPDGWTSREVGGRLVVAARAEDLDADVPAGPRVVATVAPLDVPDPAQLLAGLKTEQAAVSGQPEPVTVGGNAGLAIETSSVRGEVQIVARVVVVPLATGEAYTFTAEAPQDRFVANQATFDAILASVRFVASSPAPASP
jgi:hypothetical protein